MKRTRRSMVVACSLLVAMLACSIPRPGTPAPETIAPPEPPATEIVPAEGATRAEPLVVVHQGAAFGIYALDGSLSETRSAEGLEWARPGTIQVVGEAIYYVASGGSSLGGVVRRVTASGAEDLEFTRADAMERLTFAVSEDQASIAWAKDTWEGSAPVSRLWISDMNGGGMQQVVQSDPNDAIEDFYVLEPVVWLPGGDMVYAWQISGIGGYILFFGYSSLYRYSPASGTTIPLVPVEPEAGAPCWSALSPDGAYAVGACADGAGVVERELATSSDIAFPVLADQGQAGAGAYSPSGARLAYAIARGNFDNEAGQVLVRWNRGEEPRTIASMAPGYFERTFWADEDRLVVGAWDGEAGRTQLLLLDGSLAPIAEGRPVGLMWPASTVSTVGPGRLELGELEIVHITSTGEGFTGPYIHVQVRNPGDHEAVVRIPCGTIFDPAPGIGEQRLMVVQEAEASVGPGEEATLTPYIVCIDSDEGAPGEDSAYSVGVMASGDLLKLAQCACGENLGAVLNPMDEMSLQFAVWVAAEGRPLGDVMGEGGGAVEDLLGSEAAQQLTQLFEMMEGLTGTWFDRCDIHIGE